MSTTDPIGDQSVERQLHAAGDVEALDRQIMDLALRRSGAVNGALFLWDDRAGGLVIVLHVVGGVTVTLPDAVLRPGERRGNRPGIALWVFDNNARYLCSDTSTDDNYTRYLLDVGSIAAVPIRYQRRVIGVITVSAREPGAFSTDDLEALEQLASASATFLRRAQLDRQSRERSGRPYLIKGLSPDWREVERRIEQASPTDAPILIRGESGTGKDLVASAIHFNSKRAAKPFVTINCAAIPDTMLESILFGHVKGAFTGASFHKVGEFKKANGGTLFLDEVGELPMLLQAKVLRAVEQGEVLPLGSNSAPEIVDVRLICATNRDLAALAREGRFRDDLYYRLSVMTIELPALRDYKDNLELLAHVFLQQAAQRYEKEPPRVSPAAISALAAYDYPGNVRELKHAIEHAVIMCQGPELQLSDLPASMHAPAARDGGPAAGPAAGPGTLRELREAWLAPLERQYLKDLLDAHRGNVRSAAEQAGINAVTMYRLLKKRGLRIARGVMGEDGD